MDHGEQRHPVDAHTNARREAESRPRTDAAQAHQQAVEEFAKEMAAKARKETMVGLAITGIGASLAARATHEPYNPDTVPVETAAPAEANFQETRHAVISSSGGPVQLTLDQPWQDRADAAQVEQGAAEQAAQRKPDQTKGLDAQIKAQLATLVAEVGSAEFARFLLRKFAEGFKQAVGDAAADAGRRAGSWSVGHAKTAGAQVAAELRADAIAIGSAVQAAAELRTARDDETLDHALEAGERETRRVLRYNGVPNTDRVATQTRELFVTWTYRYS